MTEMLRGRIYRAHLTHIGEDKFFLVVSNNRRNRAFEQVLAARLTTTPPRDERPAMVPLGRGEIMTGWVSCDDIEVLYDDEASASTSARLPPSMRRRSWPACHPRHARLTPRALTRWGPMAHRRILMSPLDSVTPTCPATGKGAMTHLIVADAICAAFPNLRIDAIVAEGFFWP